MEAAREGMVDITVEVVVDENITTIAIAEVVTVITITH